MDCNNCGNRLKVKFKKVRASGATPFVLELIGVVIIFMNLDSIGLILVGFILLILGHNAAYKKEKYYICKSCKSKFDIDWWIDINN